MAKHRRRHRRNPSISGVLSAGRSAFSKEKMKTAGGLIGGMAATTALTEFVLSFGPLGMIKNNRILNVLATLAMSGVTGMLARAIPVSFIRNQAGNIAMGGVVAGVGKGLRYLTAGTPYGKYLSDYDESMSGLYDFTDPRKILGAVGTRDFTDPREIANAYQMRGFGDYESFPQVQSAVRLDGMGRFPNAVSEDDVTASVMQGMM